MGRTSLSPCARYCSAPGADTGLSHALAVSRGDAQVHRRMAKSRSCYGCNMVCTPMAMICMTLHRPIDLTRCSKCIRAIILETSRTKLSSMTTNKSARNINNKFYLVFSAYFLNFFSNNYFTFHTCFF